MAFLNRVPKQDVESGLTFRLDKDFKFLLTRIPLPEGIDVYVLENKGKNERIIIPRELFDRFRATVSHFLRDYSQASGNEQELEKFAYFREKEVYKIRTMIGDGSKIIIHDAIKLRGSSGFLTVPVDALDGLCKLFYQDSLKHTSEVFERLVRYHKLFQFSFTTGSESISSQLSLRRDVLSQIDEYVPMMRSKGNERRPDQQNDKDAVLDIEGVLGDKTDKKNQTGKFKPKLGQRDDEKSYTVDYGTLFQNGPSSAPEKLKSADDQTKRGAGATAKTFPLPIKSSDIKALSKVPFPCELTSEEATYLREAFLQDRSSELYLGFEMMDAIFKAEGKMKTFRFPLYYMKVTIEESGRLILIHPSRRAEIYLNHLALTALVEGFSVETVSGIDPLEQFYQNLTSQKIEIRGRMLDISIHRQLPVLEDVFEKTRDILLGGPGENGKGGILGNLKLIGIECDLDSVALYKSSGTASPVVQALEKDIDRIQLVAEEYPERFYRSLLGQFLTPEMKNHAEKPKPFYNTIYCPGALPQSTHELFDKLNHNEIVLLEGPPGTGKTFAIMNLLIHCVNTGQRLLVVSDQKAAIHALDEKLQEFLLGTDYQSTAARSRMTLYRQAIKLVDQLPEGQASLSQWIITLAECLAMDNSRELEAERTTTEIREEIMAIDAKMQTIREQIQERMNLQLNGGEHRRLVAPKHVHPTTQEDIKDFIAFLDYTGAGRVEKKVATLKNQPHSQIVQKFVRDLAVLATKPFISAYPFFAIDPLHMEEDSKRVVLALQLVENLLRNKVRAQTVLDSLLVQQEPSPLIVAMREQWQSVFPEQEWVGFRLARKLWSLVRHPSRKFLTTLWQILDHQKMMLQSLTKIEEGIRVARQLQGMHEAMNPQKSVAPSLALEASTFAQLAFENKDFSLQTSLNQLRELQNSRDIAVKELFLARMARIVQTGRAKDKENPTSSWTTVETLLQGLRECTSIETGVGAILLHDLQIVLVQSFPVWVCRKQAVSFLFPPKERLFDLVIIDEAGQCRVDDAIPLLYRAKKLMVVGDDKQTVLDKNSPVDDFLFQAFNLEDHLRQTQARGMKGGGSHIFGLVKSIKQAEVMLDEHFRCPAAIIHYSNKYVYASQLKVMQWEHADMQAAVVVNYVEKNETEHNKPTNGKFKDIETDLIDRFFNYVGNTIKKIEKDLGRQINLETEVALCYFLLKNEPYFKEKKPEFLLKMGRGKDVLDGAGAALQGKERNFIFYLWDVNKGNMRSFRQGDEPDKRRGELNVLMSRPKIRAYHYLHSGFETLKHDSASITDYLWSVYSTQKVKKSQEIFEPRKKRPGAEYRPWQRSSGELIRAILNQILAIRHGDKFQALIEHGQASVVVGDPRRKIDLMLLASHPKQRSLGIVDLSTFEYEKQSALAITDYYFQLMRARPAVEPIFVFVHELADERSASFQYLLQRMEELQDGE